MTTRIVVVGHGMVGSRFVDELLARDPDRRLRVTVLGDEPYGPYNRVLLSEVVAGRADVATLALGGGDAATAAGVDVRTGVAAVAVDRAARRVQAEDGRVHPYDLLVLATGSTPVVPPLAGLDCDHPPAGVRTFRTVDDCREIVAATTNARTAIVLGGGVLGVEAARGLVARGVDVTLVHAGPHLLERQLDGPAGMVLGAAVAGLGVRLVVDAFAAQVHAPGHRFGELVLRDGTRLAADLLVLACGVRPDARLVPDLAGPTGGVAVDDRLHAVDDPAVAAIGDCAEHRGSAPGLVAPGWAQARVLADLVSGIDPSARFTGERPVLRLKAADLDVAAVGDAGDLAAEPWSAPAGTEVVALADPARGVYVKAVVRDDRVVAATVVGAALTASELLLMVDRGTPAPAGRAALLLPGERGAASVADDPTRIPDRATICRCNGVTKGAVVTAFGRGARTVSTLAEQTRATTGCGSCTETCAGLLRWLADADAPPAADAPSAAGSPVDSDRAPFEPVTAGGPS